MVNTDVDFSGCHSCDTMEVWPTLILSLAVLTECLHTVWYQTLYTVDLGYTGLGYTVFGYNRSFVHSPVVSLCFGTVTTSVTPVSHISDIRSHSVSPTFPNSWFSSAIPFLAKQWTDHNGYSVFECRGFYRQSDMKAACVTWWHFVPGDATVIRRPWPSRGCCANWRGCGGGSGM
jgi:hypothetical protein